MSEEKDQRKITTPKFRVSFVQVFEPKPNMQGKPTYSVVMLFDNKIVKEGGLNDLIKIIKLAATEKWGEVPKEVLDLSEDFCPLNKGDKKEYEGYKNTIYVRAASQFPPAVVDTGDLANSIKPQAILNASEFYSGCYARASVTAYAWENKYKKKGVSIGLQNLQKLGDGEPFSGRGNPEDDFDPIVPEEVGVADTENLFGDLSSKNAEPGVEGL